MRAFLAAARFQAIMLRRSPDSWLALATAPVQTVAFVAIIRHFGREDLVPYAVLAPAVIAAWTMALFVAGDIVSVDRAGGTFELLVASPARLSSILLGRVSTVTLVSALAVPESLVVAWLVFDATVTVAHPVILGVTMLVAAFAIAGTATAMAPLFILSPSARTFQNTLSYPLLVLGGALVPVAFLPEFLHPVSRVIFLSWTTDLLRDAVEAETVPWVGPRLAAVAGLGLAGYAIGLWLLRRVIRRVRLSGEVSLT